MLTIGLKSRFKKTCGYLCSAIILLAAMSSQDAMALCVDGVEVPCIVNGKHGTRGCVNGHPTTCVAEPGEQAPPVTGTVNPKYYILTIVYAPPGTSGGHSSSLVEYGDGSSTGTIVSTSSSFKTGTKVSASVSGGTPLASATIGASFGVDADSTNGTKMQVDKSSTTIIRDSGPSLDGIDHDHDIIYLLLNPEIDVSFSGKNNIVWDMGYTGPFADIQYVYVGWLKSPAKMPSYLAGTLAAHGVTVADYQNILQADPFALGATTIDANRYLPTNTSIPYEPPFSPGDPAPTFTYVQKNDLTNTQSASSQLAYSVGLNVSGSAGFLGLFKATMAVDGSWTWTDSFDSSSSDTQSQSALVTVGSPSYGYTGPTDYEVYYDSLFKTFMFAPITAKGFMAAGTLRSRLGRAVPFQEVMLYAGGKRYRTFTNEHGGYRFVGQATGPMQIEVRGAGRSMVPASKRLDLTLPDTIGPTPALH